MPILTFSIQFGAMTQDRLLQLLCWELELSPSNITLIGNKLEVPYTPRTAEIMFIASKSNGCRFTNPRVTGFSSYITLRKMALPQTEFIGDMTGYKMLEKVSGGHPITGEWNSKKKIWNMVSGLGKHEGGIRAPVQLALKFNM
jgi:hypothetical protein